jgi:pyruvate dehydrogenase E1 component alpha subunit
MREERDPIEQVKARIIKSGMADEEELKRIDAEIRTVVTEAAEFAQSDPEPDVSELWTDVYVNA